MTDETNPKDALGMKKPPLRLVPPAALLYMAKVMGLGAKKYGPYNWRSKKVRFTVYIEAAMRHLLSAQDGETIDPESGQPHMAHAMACCAIVLDAMATGNLIDDRPEPGVAAKLIAELTEVSDPGAAEFAGPLPGLLSGTSGPSYHYDTLVACPKCNAQCERSIANPSQPVLHGCPDKKDV